MEDHALATTAADTPVKLPRVPWNKGKLVGGKPPLRPSHVWLIRTKLQTEGKKRDLALFNLAIDCKLRGCDMVAIRAERLHDGSSDHPAEEIRPASSVRAHRPDMASDRRIPAVDCRKPGQFLFAGRGDKGGLTMRQYARLVQEWVASIGLDPARFGTHSLRRTKAVLIYRRTGDLRTVQLRTVQLCSDIRRSKAPFDTSASRSMTRSKSPRRSISDR